MNTQLRAHKFAVERVLVLDNNIVSTNNGASSSAPYDNILDYKTGIYDIAAGQVGFLSKDDLTYNRILDATDFASVKKFTIIQGTGKTNINTQDGHGYTQPPYVESMLIDTQFPYWFESAYAVNDIYASMKVTGYTGTEGLKNYILNINQTGVRLQHQNSMEMKDGFAITYRSPDYATLGISAAQAKNDIYVNLAYKANLLSTAVKTLPVLSGNQPYVVFAIGTTASQSVTINGTPTIINEPTLTQVAAASAALALTIPFMIVRRNGYDTMQYFNADTALREAVAKGIADGTLTGSEVIKVIDTATALTLAKVDKLLFVALNNKLAVVTDQEPAVKTDIIITAPSAANGNNPITLQPSSYLATAPTITRISGSAEPIGSGREWLIKYRTGAKNDAYTAQMYGWTYKYIQIPDYVKESLMYNVFTLMHGVEVDDFSPKNDHYYITYILIPVMIPLTIGTPGTNEAYAYVNSEGVIVSTYFLPGQSGGAGTVTVPAIYGGSGAVLAPTYSGGGLTAIVITSGGSGYSNLAPIGSASVKSLTLPAADCTTWLGAVLTAPENGTTVTFA